MEELLKLTEEAIVSERTIRSHLITIIYALDKARSENTTLRVDNELLERRMRESGRQSESEELADLTAANDARINYIKDLQADVSSRDASIKGLKNQLDARIATINTKDTQLDDLRAEVSSRDATVTTLEGHISILTAANNTKDTHLDTLRADVSSRDVTVTILEGQISTLTDANNTMDKQLDNLRADVSSRDASIKNLENRLGALTAANDRHFNYIKDLQAGVPSRGAQSTSESTAANTQQLDSAPTDSAPEAEIRFPGLDDSDSALMTEGPPAPPPPPRSEPPMDMILFVFSEEGQVYKEFTALPAGVRVFLWNKIQSDFCIPDTTYASPPETRRHNAYLSYTKPKTLVKMARQKTCMTQRLYYAGKSEEIESTVSCKRCFRSGRICVRLMLHEATYKLCLHPFSEPDGAPVGDWTEEKYWVGPAACA
ncbi:hypothetical protein N0V83_007963 [Neocucurbitaria cava]|uniref:Uncharacterized protein n=1 Tax=Neocucurbitaria cava TaxID=798079 RepID=A0A9W8Y3A4_9PLEO|nr:hypothetical protein N0V83_007963 [Neocucurbitaria cava]